MAYPKVTPGAPFVPSAARENAINEMLNAFNGINSVWRSGSIRHDTTLYVVNNTDKTLGIRTPVQIDTDFSADEYLYLVKLYAFGNAMKNIYSPWGVALEEIKPNEAGPVQMYGVALLNDIQGKYYNALELRDGSELIESRNNFIYAGLDGKYHLGQWGHARVLWYEHKERKAVVLLGAGTKPSYIGMFAVTDNGNGTLTVKAGETDLRGYPTGVAMIEDTVIPATVSGQDNYISLNASRAGQYTWKLEVKHGKEPNAYYVPGEVMCWDLARYRGIDDSGHIYGLVQLWQGGPINFKDRYYAE